MVKQTSKMVTPFLFCILVLLGTGESATLRSDSESPEAAAEIVGSPADAQQHVPDPPLPELNEVDVDSGKSTQPMSPQALDFSEPIKNEAEFDSETFEALRLKQLESGLKATNGKVTRAPEYVPEALLKADETLNSAAAESKKPVKETTEGDKSEDREEGNEKPTGNKVSLDALNLNTGDFESDGTGEDEEDTKEEILVKTAANSDLLDDALEVLPRNAFKLFKFLAGNMDELMDRRRYERVSALRDEPKVVVVVVPIVAPHPPPSMVRPFPYMYHTRQFLGRNMKTAFPLLNSMLPSFFGQHDQLDFPMAPADAEVEKPTPTAAGTTVKAKGEIEDVVPAPLPPKEEDRLVDYPSAPAPAKTKEQKRDSQRPESGYFLH